jgi:CopA family copper-resistance protein
MLAGAGGRAEARDYSLIIQSSRISIGGKPVKALTINGQVPAPTLRFKEGENVAVHVENLLDETASLHWHGFLIPPEMDGVPRLNGFAGIAPGAAYTYRFTVRQSGTYWYHSHSGTQEQGGLYGAIIIEPREADVVQAARDYLVVLSDFTRKNPDRILRNLKADPGYYNFDKRTIFDFFSDAKRDGLGATVRDRLDWGKMRMDPTDLADVSGYTFLVNGKSPKENWTGLFAPGERVRLRFINASAMSYFDVRVPGLKLIVIQADGQNVQPVPVDEFRIAVAETYDVVVVPKEDKAYTIFAESVDRTGYARATLAPREGMSGEIPARRPRTLLTMADMGMAQDRMAEMEHGEMGRGQDSLQSMSGMDHGSTRDMGDMGDMGHGAAHDMAGMDDAAKAEANEKGAPRGWADASTPQGMKALSYADLRSLEPQKDTRAPGREIVVRLGGNMERFIWTMNGKKFEDTEPIQLRYGERVKLTFVNDTMMAHPMHLHGMFVQLVNGQPAERLPNKHVVNVAPGQSYSVLLTADEPGEWAFHCHLLYHMAAGMMTKVVVAQLTAAAAP